MADPVDPLALTPAAWESFAEPWGLPRYRGRQIFDALHRRLVADYSAMTDLPGSLRERLERELPLRRPEVARRDRSSDGSVKLGLRLSDGALIEAVYMPVEPEIADVNEFADARAETEPRPAPPARPTTGRPSPRHAAQRSSPPSPRFTVCLSSQAGCAVDCAFCVTGRLGAGRNLTAGEILGQLQVVLRETGRGAEGMRIVFMGMGEPFLNADAVIQALDVLFETVSPRRVTVSTSGITPAFARFAGLPRRPNLAVSLNAADDTTRTRIMPITRVHPLADLVRAMREWPAEPRRRILVEYVLIAGVNDSEDDARRLARLLAGMPVKINLIPLNEDPVYLPGWRRPGEAVIAAFARIVADKGHTVTVRRSKGPDASAACGQLKGRDADVRRRRNT